jgi:hypothetical protein
VLRSLKVNSEEPGLLSLEKALSTLYGGRFRTKSFFLKFSLELNDSGLSIQSFYDK